MKVIIQRHIHSSIPAEPGTWGMRAERTLPAVPREGDWIELADGWTSEKVKRTTFLAGGRVIVDLGNRRTDSPDILAEGHHLVDLHDWEWIGPSPARRRPEMQKVAGQS